MRPQFDVLSGHADSEGTMSKATLFDRLNQELEAFGKKAQAALDEGKLQIELLRTKRRRDHVARDLGLMVHRKERGGEVETTRLEALLLRMDDLGTEVDRLEQQISEAKKQESKPEAAGATVSPESPPTESPSAEPPGPVQP